MIQFSQRKKKFSNSEQFDGKIIEDLTDQISSTLNCKLSEFNSEAKKEVFLLLKKLDSVCHQKVMHKKSRKSLINY